MTQSPDPNRPATLERAYLVGVQTHDMPAGEGAELLLELRELVKNLGLAVTRSTLVNLRQPTPKLLLGSGKTEELIAQAK
jgi:GTPase